MSARVLRTLGLTRPAFLIGVVFGVAGGAGGMLIGFPFLFPPQPLNDVAPLAATELPAETRLTHAFRFDEAAPARDFLHWVNGTGAIIRTGEGHVLRFEADFTTSPGPDYHIYLTTRAITGKADFAGDTGKVEIRKIKAFTGTQNYALPKEIGGQAFDPARFHSVTIWCKFFNAYIGTAVIEK